MSSPSQVIAVVELNWPVLPFLSLAGPNLLPVVSRRIEEEGGRGGRKKRGGEEDVQAVLPGVL